MSTKNTCTTRRTASPASRRPGERGPYFVNYRRDTELAAALAELASLPATSTSSSPATSASSSPATSTSARAAG